MYRIICLAIGYCLGLVQTAFIVGKLFGKIDIREHGSGNAGTTNAVRVMGFKAGALVFVCDILKGVFGYVLCSLIFKGGGTFFSGNAMNILPGLYGGIGVILGHCFPFYLKFKGGKGMASTLGIILCINIKLALIIFAVGIVLVAVTKYISAASLTMTLMLPVMIYLFSFPLESVIIGAAITVTSWYLHRGNIKRIITGTENKFNFRKQV